MPTGNLIHEVREEEPLRVKLERARLVARERRLERVVTTFSEELAQIRERLRALDAGRR